MWLKNNKFLFPDALKTIFNDLKKVENKFKLFDFN